MSDFAVGQRWLSENETELGLGLIQAVDHRLITVYFPSNQTQRTYAKNNAPLSRVTFQLGEKIETIDEKQLIVSKIEHLNDTLIYMAREISDASTDKLIPIPETQLNHKLRLSKTIDRLFSGQIDASNWFELRYAAMCARQRLETSPVSGLQGPRVDLIAHQLYVANQVANRHAPRVLLADEVGLGKTIEAGMIIHQQLLSQRIQRVLICVPEALLHQWFVEMIRRFNLHFHIFDQQRIDSLTSLDECAFDAHFIEQQQIDLDNIQVENPFLSEQLVLCSHQFVTQCQLKQLAAGEWDLLVVDEAHHLDWSQDAASEAYLRIETIAKNTAGLLLLSATPEQLGLQGHFARLRLLDPARFNSFDAFVEEQQAYQPIADLIKQMLDSPQWDEKLVERISGYLDDIQITPSNQQQIIQQLLDRNGTSRILYRNTRTDIQGFPQRKLFAHPLAACDFYAQQTTHQDQQAIDSMLYPETQISDDSWLTEDPRVKWLAEFLKQQRSQKILVICAKKNTAIALQTHCQFKLGINCGTFHEDMDIISRDRAAAHFADMQDGATALFCSEIGSEGRNFQFTHQLVLFDLPYHPDLLEQRIGRLDRIGQTQDIHIHVPFIQQSPQQIMFNWYHLGMNAFEKTNACAAEIFKQTREQLNDTLKNYSDTPKQNALIETTRQITNETNQKVASGKDKLLSLASFDPQQAEQLIKMLSDQDATTPHEFMSLCWNVLGVDVEEYSQDTYVIIPGPHMFFGYFPGLPGDGITATYSRQTALARDDIAFLSWEHPMVTRTIDLLLSEDKGNACVCVLKNPAVKPGTLLVESIYQIACVAPRYLQAQRFLPYQTLRVLMDAKGNDMADKVSHRALCKQCERIPKNTAREIVKSESKTLRQMIKTAEEKAAVKAQAIMSSVVEKMHQQQSAELNRMIALQKKNPNIRQTELNFIRSQTELLEKHLTETQLELAAVRAIIAV